MRRKILIAASVAGTIIGMIIHRVAAVIEFIDEKYTDIIVGFKVSVNEKSSDQNRK